MTPNACVGPSKIHGEGVFASRNIAKGEQIVTVDELDVVFTQEETQAIAEKAGAKTAAELEEAVIAAVLVRISCPGFNHSCAPNCVRDGSHGRALQDIPEGEELTIWYGNWSAWLLSGRPCLCPSCIRWVV
jgi:hypothetical protein